MDLKTEYECPLGKRCLRAEDRCGEQVLVRCAWLVELRGKDPQSDRELDESRCALAWVPILLVENARTNRGQTAAIESFRNAMVEQQALGLRMLARAAGGAEPDEVPRLRVVQDED